MIRVENLRVVLQDKLILDQISFELQDNENLVILGKSGSGKTVLIKSLLGIIVPQSGSIKLDGVDINSSDRISRDSVKSRFAMVFQNAALLDSFNVFQNVALPLYERGELSDGDISEKVDLCLDKVGLKHTRNLYPSELSGGMRKRIGIARALAYDPAYIIFDEPISGLDPITSREIIYYISKVVQSKEVGVITITHDLRDLEDIADKLLFIDAGKALYFGPTSQVHKSDNPLIREFLS